MADPARPQAHYPRWLWLVGLGLVAVVVAAVVAIASIGTGGPTDLGAGAIERLIPSAGAQVLRQEPIGVDLAPGWDGSLTVNGIPVPPEQLATTDALNLVMFTPGAGRVIEELPAGETCVVATYWRHQTGPADATARSWCFTVL